VGVVFLGTPHRGSGAQKWGQMVVNCIRLFGLHADDGILKDLEEGSSTQLDLLRNFVRLAKKHNMEIVCFFEQHMTNYAKRLGVKIPVSV
jgi:hypothetical protein